MSGLVFNAISLLQKETGHFCYNIASPKVAVILKISEPTFIKKGLWQLYS